MPSCVASWPRPVRAVDRSHRLPLPLLVLLLVGAVLEEHARHRLPREGARGEHVPQVQSAIENILGQQRREGLLDVRMDVRIRVVHVGAPPQLPEVVNGLILPPLGLLRAEAVDIQRGDHLRGQPPEVGRCVLVTLLDHCVVRQLLHHLQRQVGPLRLLVGVKSVVKTIVERKPLCPWQVDLRGVLGMLLAQLEGLVPPVGLHVQRDEHTDIADLDDRFLGELVVLMLAERPNRHVQQLRLRTRQLPNNLDQALECTNLDEDLDCLAMLAGSEVHLAGGPQVSILL
mmetsp:Transcript_31102/g.78696  ORF Transcript_31102/g.78696 Transcript_31102/m.78696 type:complete len:286 (+) Transcript_31102:940-1797(+)